MAAHGWCLMVHGVRGPRATQNDSTLMLSVPVGFSDIATAAYLGLGACVARASYRKPTELRCRERDNTMTKSQARQGDKRWSKMEAMAETPENV